MVLAVMALAVLSLGMLQVSLATGGERRVAGQRLNAKLAAEAALAITAEELLQLELPASFSMATPWDLGAAEAYVEVTELPPSGTADPVVVGHAPQLFKLHAAGFSGPSRLGVEMVVIRTQLNAFEHGAFALAGVALGGDVLVDGFDSRIGVYTPSGTGPEASIASPGLLHLEGHAEVFGNVFQGPSSDFLALGNAIVHGDVLETAGTLGFVAPTPPTEESAAPLPDLQAQENGMLASDQTDLGHVVIENSVQLTLTGPATISMASLELQPGAELIVDATAGPVEILVAGPVTLETGAKLGSTDSNPGAVTLFCMNPGDPGVSSLQMGDHAEIHGAVVAPGASILIDSASQIFGSIAARYIDLAGPFQLHHDVALRDVDSYDDIELKRIGWRVLGVPSP